MRRYVLAALFLLAFASLAFGGWGSGVRGTGATGPQCGTATSIWARSTWYSQYGASTTSVSWGSQTFTTGDFVIVLVAHTPTSVSVTSVTDDASNTYTMVPGSDDSTGWARTSVWYSANATGGNVSWTANFSGTVTGAIGAESTFYNASGWPAIGNAVPEFVDTTTGTGTSTGTSSATAACAGEFGFLGWARNLAEANASFGAGTPAVWQGHDSGGATWYLGGGGTTNGDLPSGSITAPAVGWMTSTDWKKIVVLFRKTS